MAAQAQLEEDEFDWEEWDREKMPFHVHMAAGSFAGVMEHLVMYPVDTIKVRRRRGPFPAAAPPLGGLAPRADPVAGPRAALAPG